MRVCDESTSVTHFIKGCLEVDVKAWLLAIVFSPVQPLFFGKKFVSSVIVTFGGGKKFAHGYWKKKQNFIHVI